MPPAQHPVTTRGTVRRRGLLHLLVGVAGLVLAVWGLLQDIRWIAQPFYAYAWWSFIFLLDGIVAVKRGDSLLLTRRSLIGPIVLWSVSFWFFFELLNLRFQNWYYVGVFMARSGADLILGGLFAMVCFATVFTGLFQTYDAVTAFALFRGATCRRRQLGVWVSYAIQGVGAVMALAAILSPQYLAPLIWGSLTFLLDPWNYRHGARSLLRDFEQGDLRPLVRLLFAGLICGLVWESFNFLAPQKWIYTVRGLEQLKLFEMPLLGFLGFPALALDSFSAFALISLLFHGNRTWEHHDHVPHPLEPTRPVSRALFFGLVPLHMAFWALVAILGETVSVGSIELEMSHLETLPSIAVDRLAANGIERPRQLLSATRDPGRRARLEQQLGFTHDELEQVLEEARLFAFKGIGPHHGRLLRRCGIQRWSELQSTDPDELYERLMAKRREGEFPALRLGMVRVWVYSARAR